MSESKEKLVLRWALMMIIYLALCAVLVFLSAGDWAWPGGWWFIGLQFLNTIGTGVLFVADRPELLARRSQVGEGTQAWDQVLARLMAYSTLLIAIITALGFRFAGGWGAPLWARIAGVLVATAGHALTTWAMRANPFFESTTRIQSEHGHRVVSQGPYRWVRHPGYLGVTLYNIALPLIMNSVWGFVGVGLYLVVLVWRTILEDRFLRENLEGYTEYTEKTRWQLIPGVW